MPLVGCEEEEHYYIKVCSDFNPCDKRPYGLANLCIPHPMVGRTCVPRSYIQFTDHPIPVTAAS